jgi:hypothetical protein
MAQIITDEASTMSANINQFISLSDLSTQGLLLVTSKSQIGSFLR